jgi:2-oxoisovalerate dehydrogenase E1 component
VTLIAYGGMLPIVEALAEELISEELAVEIVAPSLVNPLPRHQLARHLMDRQAVVVAEEAYAETGFGAALGSLLMESGFRGRFSRVSPPPVPIPAARSLESKVLPGRAALLQAVLRTLAL